MTIQTKISEFEIPAHIDPSKVVDYNVYDDFRFKEAGDPHKTLYKLGEEVGRGIFWTPHNGGHWFINSHELLFQASRDTGLFSSNDNTHRDGGMVMVPAMPDGAEPRFAPQSIDPPVHGAYRVPLMKVFAPNEVLKLEARIRKLAVGLIEDLAPKGRGEFLFHVGEPLPVVVFLTIMGMPLERLHEFRSWMDAMASDEQERRTWAFDNIAVAMGELVQQRKAKREDDLISKLLDCEINGAPPTNEDMASYCLLLFTAGLDTLVNAFTFGAYQLAQDVALQERIRADRTLIAPLIEEILRRYGVAMPPRLITRDAEFGGVRLKKGERVVLMVPAGNLDPAAFPDPMRFDIDREDKTHITFNSGPHRCVGSHLARLEMRVLFEEWFERMPNIHLDPEAAPTFREGLNLTIRTLPLVWEPVTA